MRPILTTLPGDPFSDQKQTITNQYYESSFSITTPGRVLSIIVQSVNNSSMIKFSFIFSNSDYTFTAPSDSYVTQLYTHNIGSSTPSSSIMNLVVSFVSRLDQIVVSTPEILDIDQLNSNPTNKTFFLLLNANYVSLDDYYPKLFEEEPEP